MTRRMAEVARKVGVSEATVSRVLNGKPGVSEATRTAVLTALDVLGYERPTQLRGERARLVGLVLPELQNPIFPAFAEVVSGGIVQRGMTPVLCIGSAGGMSEPAYVQMLLQQQASGVIFFGGAQAEDDAPHDHFVALHERGVPAVLVNAAVEALGFPTVSTDDRAAVQLAFTHLRSLGHERIGLVLGPLDHVPSRRKEETFRALCAEEGLSLDGAVERTMFTLEGGQLAASILLERGFTAALFASDPLALGGIKAARRAGLSVPRDFSVVGFDDSALMGCTEPPLSTVRQPIEAIGKAAVALLVDQISGAAGTGRELLFEPELVVRATTGAAPRR
ncbi:LacI family transcriptional regulator [Motilibacter rhizosphaerae]|uniref:LacI family transcriptional regulator n=1 Tax=Motilibacter rhizosphaerae TaxID=598652 RepID=A0A4Q7NVZ8_9ACTN|nr:LacI family DNA-binding transcriptional regulator [Motilibacter rhizosphaerae]RZS91334.1 LacI family transcriptional regulator [Motilibacter rhizosphaerae]